MVLLAITLPVKLATLPPRIDTTVELQQKFQALRSFLAGHVGATPLTVVRGNRSLPWFGLSFAQGTCKAIALPNIYGQDGAKLLQNGLGRQMQAVHIYRGRFFDAYPHPRIALDDRLLRAFHSRWRHALSVILLTSGNCAAVLNWDWRPLWH